MAILGNGNSTISDCNTTDVTKRLAAPRQEIEQDFIQMGSKLIASTRLLNETSGAYGQMAGALAGSDFSNLTIALRELSKHIASVDSARIATLDFLTGLQGLTDQFPDRNDLLTRAVRTLRMYFVTARVTASVGGTKEVNLQQFTDQFSDLGSRLDGNVSSFIDAFKSMGRSLDAAKNMYQQLGAQHADLVDGVAVEQMNNLVSMETHRIWAEGQISAHDDRNERINARISRAVGTLQVGDSTRQRVEHVEKVLQDLKASGDESILSASYSLMAAQLRGAIDDFDSESSVLIKSFEELIVDTEEMLQRADQDSEKLLSSGDTALGMIGNSLQLTVRMLEQYERGNAAGSVAIDQLVTAVSNMLQHIGAFDTIRKTIHLISINSTIKAKALNEDGHAFQQVAYDLRTLSDEINTPVEAVIKNLQQSKVLMRDFLEKRDLSKIDNIKSMQEAVNKASQSVAHISGQLRRQSECMAETGPEALSQLKFAAATVHERQDFCAEWRIVASELSKLAAEQEMQGSAYQLDHDFFMATYEQYTMNAERKIHKTLFGQEPKTENKPSSTNDAAEGPALDDIFF